jgi:RHS repeat-associated protein
VRAVVDSSGAPQWNYAYEPYGATRSAVAVSGRQAPTNLRQYLGAHVDGTAYDLNARQYLPGTGRFLSPDPAANPGLGYGSANPLLYLDPFGMDDFDWRHVVHDVSSGVATAAGTILVGCTLAVICAETDVITAPLAGIAGVVSWATDDNTSRCLSGKGGCGETVLGGALAGVGFGGLAAVDRLGRAAEGIANEGIYVIHGSKGAYVGQSGNITRRLGEHVSNLKFTQQEVDAAERYAVSGGKTARGDR